MAYVDLARETDAERVDYPIPRSYVRAKCRVIKGMIAVTKVLDWLVYATLMAGLPPFCAETGTRKITLTLHVIAWYTNVTISADA